MVTGIRLGDRLSALGNDRAAQNVGAAARGEEFRIDAQVASQLLIDENGDGTFDGVRRPRLTQFGKMRLRAPIATCPMIVT